MSRGRWKKDPMFTFFIVVAYLLLSVELLILVRSFRYARRERRRRRKKYAPKAVILAPHYGWNDQIERNARLLLRQDYPGEYEVCFITHERGKEGADDSYGPLAALAEENRSVRVVLAPNIVDNALPRSQKVQNLLTAVNRLDEDVEVLAFVDADSRVRKDWLRKLVEPLSDETIGVTVGARYYVPQVLRVPTLVESVWINFQLFWQGDHSFAMVWGGSTAIRRKTFRLGEVSRRWMRAAFEDHQLTRSVRNLGLKIHFVPDCVVVTETGRRTWRQVMEFTNRQILVTYRMGLRVQWATIIALFVPKALIVLGALPYSLSSPGRLAAIGAIPFLEGLCYLVAGLNLPRWLRREPKLARSQYVGSFVVPLAMSVAVINAVNALFHSEFVWGGVRYVLPSPSECHVVGRESE